MADHEDPGTVFGQADELDSLGRIRAEWLLAEDVLAREQGGFDNFVMRGGGSGDHDGVDIGSQEVLVAGSRP
jgi:hypothetical protein